MLLHCPLTVCACVFTTRSSFHLDVGGGRRHSPSATPSDYNSGYVKVFDAVPPSSMPNYSPKANTLHHTPPNRKTDVGNGGLRGKTIPPKPLRSSLSSHTTTTTTTEGSDHSPQQTSPVLISPPPAHQKMFIRASSESSGPDTITLNPYSSSASDQGSEFANNAESAILVFTGPSGWDSKEARVGGSPPKRGVSSSPLGRSEMDDSASHVGRVGSASSNTSSEVSVGGSLKKPPKPPKPQLLSPKPKLTLNPASKAESASSATPAPSTEGGAAAYAHSTPQVTKPPPKPSRGLSQKAKTATSKPSPATPSVAMPTTATPSTSTPKRAPPTTTTTMGTGRGTAIPAQKPVLPNGIAQVTLRPSVPASAGGDNDNGPPPKPARASMRLPQTKGEAHESPLPPQTRDDSSLPPPKPSRRGKSVKIADPLTRWKQDSEPALTKCRVVDFRESKLYEYSPTQLQDRGAPNFP